jgi:hypothetical protein
MVKLGGGEDALFRLDASPLDGEPVGIQAEAGEEFYIVGIAMVVIAGVPGGFGEKRGFDVLEYPEIAIHVVAFYLVGGSRRAPEEAIGEFIGGIVRHCGRSSLSGGGGGE